MANSMSYGGDLSETFCPESEFEGYDFLQFSKPTTCIDIIERLFFLLSASMIQSSFVDWSQMEKYDLRKSWPTWHDYYSLSFVYRLPCDCIRLTSSLNYRIEFHIIGWVLTFRPHSAFHKRNLMVFCSKYSTNSNLRIWTPSMVMVPANLLLLEFWKSQPSFLPNTQ